MRTVTLAAAQRGRTRRIRTSPGTPELHAALGRLAGAELCLDLDLAVRRPPGGTARLHARHGIQNGRVTAVTSALGPVVEVADFDAADWQAELARTVQGSPGEGEAPPPTEVLDLPWSLLVGTGAALAQHRLEVYDVLVARAVGAVRVDGVVLDLAGCHALLRRLHRGVAGRLRVVARNDRDRPLRGWVTWLLFADGWRALTPYADPGMAGGRLATVRLEPRRPLDLGLDVARWVARIRG